MELKGKTAIITGGASGLGEATARRFVKAGAKVVLADIQEEKGKAVAADLGAAAIFVKTDLSKMLIFIIIYPFKLIVNYNIIY